MSQDGPSASDANPHKGGSLPISEFHLTLEGNSIRL